MIGMEAETPRWNATNLFVALCAFCLITVLARGLTAEMPLQPPHVSTSPRASLDTARLERQPAGGTVTKGISPPARRDFGYRIVLGREGAVVLLKGATSRPSAPRLEFQNKPFGEQHAVFGIRLLGADPEPGIESSSSSGSSLSRVRYADVYPSIDWVWLGARDQIEYDFVVRPGGDPRRIRLSFENVSKLEIDKRGDLVLHVGKSKLRHSAPYAYQESGGHRRRVEASYVSYGKEGVGFRLGKYDPKLSLIID